METKTSRLSPCVIFSRRNGHRPPPPPPLRRPFEEILYDRPGYMDSRRRRGRGGGLEGNTTASGRIYSCHWKRGSKEEEEDDAFIGTEA